tara:strand:+ start:697 stop:867 length:171 start_codon:yes stop_codon:yes gene_type:complete
MKKLIFLLLLASCTTDNENKKINKEILNFDKDLTFKEFNILAQKYSDINIYPNINK